MINLLKVVITNLEAGSTMDIDAKKWTDAQMADSSSSYNVLYSNSDIGARTTNLKRSSNYKNSAMFNACFLSLASAQD